MIFPELPIEYAENRYILRWWQPKHDELLQQLAASLDWYWMWDISTAIQEITTPEALNIWRKEDPLCHRYAWYNVLMYFAVARAQQHGLDDQAARPQVLECFQCGESFNQEDLPQWAMHRLGGMSALRFCLECTKRGFFGQEKRPRCSKKSVKFYLSEVHRLSGQIPGTRFFEAAGALVGLKTEIQRDLLALGATRPRPECIKRLYTSHLAALIDADVLPEGTRRTARGTHCIANDGHLCLSLGEKVIDDWLSENGYLHDKEPHWPESNMRADFRVGKTYIEYFGLVGDPIYDVKIIQKREIARKHGIHLVELYPSHIQNWTIGQEMLSSALRPN